MSAQGMRIAVVGSGIAGLSAAWLLSQRHQVTLYDTAPRAGDHGNTVEVDGVPIDSGLIVYNEATYRNLTALFAHLGVRTKAVDMNFAVSLDGGRLEYAGSALGSLFAQRRNLIRPRFWSMLRDLRRFYHEAPANIRLMSPYTTLGTFLDTHGYGEAFQQDHLLPMAATIWSGSTESLRDYPALHFIRFCDSHGLLQFTDRPVWRTVEGGSREYVKKLLAGIGEARLGRAACSIRRGINIVVVGDTTGCRQVFDHVVLACHADQALALLDDPSDREDRLLRAFRYTRNRAVLHRDARLMPRRRSVWASWNYLDGHRDDAAPHVTYWMNKLQGLSDQSPMFVTLNPSMEPEPVMVLGEEIHRHPVFDMAAMRAQDALWTLQGRHRTWFCGDYFGASFHEAGLQSGLAVAEQLGGVRRLSTVRDESGRIALTPVALPEMAA